MEMQTEGHGAAETCLLKLSAPPELASRLADALTELFFEEPPAVSLFELEENKLWGLNAYFQPGDNRAAPDRALIKSAFETAAAPNQAPDFTLEPMAPVDWVSHVQSRLTPVGAGRFLVHGSHDREPGGRRAGDIEIEAGQAFGSAHHATTLGCLLALDLLFRRYHYNRVLDLGTGSGLLAIAAARILKPSRARGQYVLASDIDPVAVRVAVENAAINEVAPKTRFMVASGLNQPVLRRAAPYDLLIANILAAPLRKMAPEIKAALHSGSHLVLSGILATQAASIEARYRNFGFRLLKRLPIDEWMTLILRLD